MSKTFWHLLRQSVFVLSVTVLSFLSLDAYASNQIQLQSEVVNGRLVPSIVINGQTVMTIQDRGNRKLFQSNYDRADTIYNSLVELEEKGVDVSTIRVNRYKSLYSGMIGTSKLFTIYKGDIVANNLSAYKLAKKWSSNIKDAVAAGPIVNTDGIPLSNGYTVSIADIREAKTYPLMGFISAIGKKGAGVYLFQLLFFGFLQVLIAIAVFSYYQKKQRQRDRLFFSRLDKLNYILSYQKQELKQFSEQLEHIKALNRKAPIRLSDEGNGTHS